MPIDSNWRTAASSRGSTRSRELAAAIPGARFEILEGADHQEAVGNDPRLRRMVSAFLAEDPLE